MKAIALLEVQARVAANTGVDAMEKEPGEKWKKVTWEVQKYVLLAVAGLLVGMILKTP